MKEENNNYFVPNIYYTVFRKCSPDWRIRPHFVDHNDITYIIRGSARYTIDRKTHELGPGNLICLTDGVEKEAVTNPKNLMHCFSVNFDSLYTSKKTIPQPQFPTVSNIGKRRDIIDMFREMTISWAEQQEGYVMKSHALLMLILNRLSEILIYDNENMTGDFRVSKVKRFITMHYSDKLKVENLAEQVHLNPSYLGQLFKQQTGISINRYITQIRVRNAENMLQSGNYKVQAVAEHCGFSDVTHFYKLFREIRGFPPSKCKLKN